MKSAASPQAIWKTPVKCASSHPETNAVYTAKQGTEPLFWFHNLSPQFKTNQQTNHKGVYICLRIPLLKPQANSFQQSDTVTFLDHFPSKNIQWLWPSLLWSTLGQRQITLLRHTFQVKKLKWWNQWCKYNRSLHNTAQLQSSWTAKIPTKPSTRGKGDVSAIPME